MLEPIHFAGTTQQMQALATGDLDLANLAYSAIGLAIQNAGLDDLRVIFDGVQDGYDGYYSNEFMVLKDGPVKTVADLKGKVLATNAIGAGVDIGMRAVLRRNHLEDKRDYQVVETQFPNMKQLLLDHKADLIVAVPPFSYDPELRANARTLFTLKDAFGVTQLTAMTAREGFIKQHRAVIVDFMEDAIRAIHWYTDPKNHDEAVKIVSGFMKRAARALSGLAVHQEGRLPRPERQARPGRLAAQSQHPEIARPAQRRYRREEIQRSEHGEGGGARIK